MAKMFCANFPPSCVVSGLRGGSLVFGDGVFPTPSDSSNHLPASSFLTPFLSKGNGISAVDIKKLKENGFHTVESGTSPFSSNSCPSFACRLELSTFAGLAVAQLNPFLFH